MDDARALEIEMQGRDRRPPDPASVDDEELKLIALNALIDVEWERARPHLEKFLAAGASPKMRERALFVLSQSDAPQAKQMLLSVARDPNSPELAREAVHYLAFYDDEESRPLLRRLYAETPHREVKEAALEALMIAGDLEGLRSVVRAEPDVELRASAIEQLGFLGATDDLRSLYAGEASVELKHQILEALMFADDEESLIALARSEPNEELRATAIEQLGHLDARAELRQLYTGEASAAIREQIAEALWMVEDTEFLAEIARNDASAEVREQAIEALGLIGSPAAAAVLTALYGEARDSETKEAVLEAFIFQDDPAPLIEIARAEADPELRRKAIEVLTMMDSEAATEFLLRILEDG